MLEPTTILRDTVVECFEMRSLLFTEFGIPDAECDIEPDFHPQFRVPYLFFRQPGNRLKP
jgi:hypothetical protein